MTPAARAAAAVEILDRVGQGEPAERALTNWARGSRYAGSGDRAAVRDLVYDIQRRRRSAAALGGGEDGRALLLGHLRAQGQDPDAVFSGARHAPAPLSPAERSAGRAPAPGAEALDLPDWLWPRFHAALGEAAAATAERLRTRAPVGLRVNLRKISREDAVARLAAAGIAATPHPLSPAALTLGEGARRLRTEGGLAAGLWELQDPASQAVADLVPLPPGGRLLDFCAGGGGKTLAVAARVAGHFVAHDAVAARMADLPARATRAGITVRCVTDAAALAGYGPYDVVLADAPCSGSGSWRRDPEGKWRLSSAGFDRLCATQDAILDACAGQVAPGGVLIYVTCSVLREENEARVTAFLDRHPGWHQTHARRFGLVEGGDGFTVAALTAKEAARNSTAAREA